MEAKGKDLKVPLQGAYSPSIHVNWMEEGILNKVRKQSGCNCCWAIVSAAAIESMYNIKNRPIELLQLSVQELVNCVKPEKESCYLSSINKGYEYTMQFGIGTEADCPYIAKKQPCCEKPSHMWALKIENFKKIVDGDEIGLMEAVKNQPVGAALYVTHELEEYKEGIYEGPPFDSKEKGNFTHAVLVVGYGSDEETKKNFWWIMNSWGVNWGINGFAKVVRNSSLPKGSASLLFRASYPILF